MDCRHHPRCPGCPLLPRAYPAQLAAKRERLARALARYDHLPEAPPVRPAVRTEGYRHRLKLPVVHDGDQVRMGLLDSQGKVVHTPDCPVLAPALREAIPPLLRWLAEKRSVHSVDLRASDLTGQLQLVLACRQGRFPGHEAGARALMRAIPSLSSVAVSSADPEGKRVMGRNPKLVAGQEHLPEAIGPTRYVLYPGAFFQADPQNAVQIHELVRAWVGDAERVADLYAGVGAYGRMLAARAKRVFMVEEVPQAARAASVDAPPHVEVVAARVEDVVLRERFDAVVLNPARRGCEPDALIAVAKATDRLVMVSCGPESLARDLDVLAAHGLRVADLQAVDLFPQTAEVETVVRLERGPPRTRWKGDGGTITGPWAGRASGAEGTPSEVLVLAVGDASRLRLREADVRLVARVAGHSLVRLTLGAPLERALNALRRAGHPIAGEDPKTRRFFAEKGLLVRPFVHVSRAGGCRAPLHGDLQTTLDLLDSEPRTRKTRPRPRPRRRGDR